VHSTQLIMPELVTLGNSKSPTSPRRLRLPTSLHRHKLRDASSGKPGGYVGQTSPLKGLARSAVRSTVRLRPLVLNSRRLRRTNSASNCDWYTKSGPPNVASPSLGRGGVANAGNNDVRRRPVVLDSRRQCRTDFAPYWGGSSGTLRSLACQT
jgi:hypothetical protein